MTCHHPHGWNEDVLVSTLTCRSCGLVVKKGVDSAVLIGDTMQVSVELIKQIAEMPALTTELLTLVGVRVQADGSKLLMLQRVGPGQTVEEILHEQA